MRNYVIEKMDLHNVEHYARVSALSWLQSYKRIVNDEFLKLINTEEEIQKAIINLKSGLNDDSRRMVKNY